MELRSLGLERAVEELALEAERIRRVRRMRTRKQQVTSSDSVSVHDGLDDFRIRGCLVFIITKILNEFGGGTADRNLIRRKRRKLIGSVFGLCNVRLCLLFCSLTFCGLCFRLRARFSSFHYIIIKSINCLKILRFLYTLQH